MNISKLTNVLLVLTFFCLWLTGFSSELVEQYLALSLIFSFGILHGANDISILRKMKPDLKGRRGDLYIVAAYAGFVLLIALIFYAIPLIALLFFIIISAYHFGEQHWQGRTDSKVWLTNILYFSYGMTILLMLFHAHAAEVSETIEAIGAFYPEPEIYRIGAWISAAFLALSLALNFNPGDWLKLFPREILLLGVFYVVFMTASLIWAFAIYFILWHSIPSLMDQISLLYGKHSVKNGLKYLKNSAVYWIAAMVSLVVAFFFFRDTDYGFLPLFFSFLAAITFPHVLVMGRLYKR